MTKPRNTFYDNLDLYECPDCHKLHDPRIYCLSYFIKAFPPAHNPSKGGTVTAEALLAAAEKLELKEFFCGECGGIHESASCIFPKITFPDEPVFCPECTGIHKPLACLISSRKENPSK